MSQSRQPGTKRNLIVYANMGYPVATQLADGSMSVWENLAIEELPTGELLIVYDVQNWIEAPGAPPRKAIRAVRMRRKKKPQIDTSSRERTMR